MDRIRNKFQALNDASLSKIIISNNPAVIYGLQFALKTRLLFFKHSGGRLFIDYNEQKIFSNYVYIIPPMHFQYLHGNNFHDCICIEIDDSILTYYHKKLLYSLKYKRNKAIKISDDEINNCFDAIAEMRDHDLYKSRILDIVMSWIEACMPEPLIKREKSGNLISIKGADNLMALISKKDLTIGSSKIHLIALEMFSTERNLHRICINAFGLSAKGVLKYHLASKAIYLLSDRGLSISDVARELDFYHLSSFNRYILRLTGFTPTDIRTYLNEIGLLQ